MRLVVLAAATVAGGLLVTGCGPMWANPSAIRAPNQVSTNLQNKVVDTLDSYGLPVSYDYVGCQGPNPYGAVSCFAETAEEPTGDIVASFAVHRRSTGCPGTLVVKMNGTVLAQVKANPCR